MDAVGTGPIAGFDLDAMLADPRAGIAANVGDHPGGVQTARVAGAVSVALATGAYPAAELAACGADVTLAERLAERTELPPWLATFETERSRQ